MDYITEHYLKLAHLLAADKPEDVARQALGIASASDDLLKQLEDPTVEAAATLKPVVAR